MHGRASIICLPLLVLFGGTVAPDFVHAQEPAGSPLFARQNLVAWCIVPFDSKKRGPEARAEMLSRLGITQLAYDWRAEHIPTFDEEIQTLRRWNIRLRAFWFPSAINDEAKQILDALKRHNVKTELWVSFHGGEVECSPEEHQARVAAHVEALRPIVAAAEEIGCTVGLYNHMGWFGEPENQIEIIKQLNAPNVGIIYNQHHGHAHVDRFPKLLEKMMPYLYCINLNGMMRDGEQSGRKIWPLGSGELDLELLRAIRDSGYKGPIGILGHTMEDAELTLHDNLDGLDWLLPQVDGAAPAGPRPTLRVGSPQSSAEIEDPARRQALPEFQIIPAANPERLAEALPLPSDFHTTWRRSHGNAHNTRYAAINQITRENVRQLKLAWDYRSGDAPGNVQCNPIVVDGTMYAPTSGGHLVALDATNGHERWRFKPGGTPAHRGLVYWAGTGAHRPRLFINAGDFLWAIDPETGKPLEEFGDAGKVVTGEVRVAGAVHKDVLVLAGYARDVFGYDARTGEQLWVFHTIPVEGEYGSDTWEHVEEGANCWGGIALDEARGIAYISTGSPKPNFAGNTHRGQNLFANCVIALDAQTGKRLWHFQEIRHDIWDLDIPAPPILVTITKDGRRVDAVAQCTKIGNTLVLDRVTGEPLFPVRLRRAPVSTVPGERTWPYQPDIELPEPFARQVFTLDDVTDRTPEARQHVMDRIANAAYGWFEPMHENKPTVLYGFHGGTEWTGGCFDPERGRLYVSANNVPWIVTLFQPDRVVRDPNVPPTRGELVYREHCVSCHGPDRFGVGMNPPLHGLARRTNDADVRELLRTGRNAMPAASHAITETDIAALLDFIFLRDVPQVPLPDTAGQPLRYTHNGYPKLLDNEGYPGCKPPWGTLNCIDLASGKTVWQVPLGVYPDLAMWGEDNTGAENFGGPSVTAGGLVFCAGTPDNLIRAFDSDTGAVVWEHELPFGGYAPPSIFDVNGTQYVVIAATGGGKLGTPIGDAYVAFALE